MKMYQMTYEQFSDLIPGGALLEDIYKILVDKTGLWLYEDSKGNNVRVGDKIIRLADTPSVETFYGHDIKLNKSFTDAGTGFLGWEVVVTDKIEKIPLEDLFFEKEGRFNPDPKKWACHYVDDQGVIFGIRVGKL